MQHTLLGLFLLTVLSSINALAAKEVSDEISLNRAITMANADSSINTIVFKKNAQISLTSPVIYTGSQDLSLFGNGATIDGNSAGKFVLDSDLTAISTDGTLVFNTAGDISLINLSVVNSATRGIVINVPDDAQGDDIKIYLHQVNILNSALYGLHIDDNSDEFDQGLEGSAIGIKLNILQSSFIGNGTGAIDFDGVRVDERGQGGIHALIIDTHIDGNGGDGIELDEAGEGNVDATMRHVTLNDNGFFNNNDLDDGFDIDEAGSGDIQVSLSNVQVKNNMDEGLDFDEAGDGNVGLMIRRLYAINNSDEGIKVDENGAGNIDVRAFKVMAMESGDDGIQFTELGEGHIDAELNKVTAKDNKKNGIKIEQWFIEDEEQLVENNGTLNIAKLMLSGNVKSDQLKLHNVIVEQAN